VVVVAGETFADPAETNTPTSTPLSMAKNVAAVVVHEREETPPD
jgi:hypothetical protein